MRPYLYLALVIALWASTPTVVDHLYKVDHLSVLFVLAATCAISAATLLAGAWVTGRLREARSYTRRDWATVIAMGLLGAVAYTAFYYLAYDFAPPDEVSVVNYLWPVLLVLFSGPILGERHGAWVWAGIALSFIGTAGIMTGWHFRVPTGLNLVGYVSAATGAACWALFSNFGKRLRYDKLTSMALYLLVGAIVFGAALLIVGYDNAPSAASWARLVFLGAAVNGLAYFLWFKALAGGPTAIFGNLIYLTPFLSLVYLWIFRGTPFRPGVWVSLGLIVVGALISIHSARKRLKFGVR